MASPSMTIVIPSYERCEPLRRLLQGLADQLTRSDSVRTDLDVVVVLDGTSDGSDQMLAQLDFPARIAVKKQAHRGLAAARNAGLDSASGRIVWFLDDDLVPCEGLIARHRGAHRLEEPEVVVGAAPIPPDLPVAPDVRQIWGQHYARMEVGPIERFEQVTFANTSCPAYLLQKLGGFDERFIEYGFEDRELGVRLLEDGARIRFDPEAIAWHHPVGIDFEHIRARSRVEGRNMARFARIHPSIADRLFATEAFGHSMRFLGKVGLRSPRSLAAASSMVALGARTTTRMVGERGSVRLRGLSRAIAFAAGIADLDDGRDLLPRLVGRPTPP